MRVKSVIKDVFVLLREREREREKERQTEKGRESNQTIAHNDIKSNVVAKRKFRALRSSRM